MTPRIFTERMGEFAKKLEQESGEPMPYVLITADVTEIEGPAGTRDRMDVSIKSNTPADLARALVGIAADSMDDQQRASRSVPI